MATKAHGTMDAHGLPPQALAETTSPEGNEVQRFLVFLVELS